MNMMIEINEDERLELAGHDLSLANGPHADALLHNVRSISTLADNQTHEHYFLPFCRLFSSIFFECPQTRIFRLQVWGARPVALH